RPIDRPPPCRGDRPAAAGALNCPSQDLKFARVNAGHASFQEVRRGVGTRWIPSGRLWRPFAGCRHGDGAAASWGPYSLAGSWDGWAEDRGPRAAPFDRMATYRPFAT